MCNFLFGVANKTQGCCAFKALDGETAADILASEKIDMLITDIEMKGLNGLELLYQVRCGLFDSTAHDIPVILFSGNSYRDLIKQSIDFDVNHFLVKPITAAQLQSAIQHHLHHKKEIKSIENYVAMKSKLLQNKLAFKDAPNRIRVSIVRSNNSLSEKDKLPDEHGLTDKEYNDKADKLDFLFWPENSTTGYFQLDRRLRTFALTVSVFHYLYIGKCKSIAIESGRNRACDSAGYLFYIAKNIQPKELRQEFWLPLNQRLEELKSIIEELSQINIKNHSQMSVLLKKLSSWWVKTCNLPIIQKSNQGKGS